MENKCQFHQLLSSMMEASLIKSDIKSCPTFTISVTSLHKFCKSMNLPNPTRTQTIQFWFGLGSSGSRVWFKLYKFFYISVLVRFCQNVGSSSVRFPSLISPLKAVQNKAHVTWVVLIYSMNKSPLIMGLKYKNDAQRYKLPTYCSKTTKVSSTTTMLHN